jgi:hypothetical protein
LEINFSRFEVIDVTVTKVAALLQQRIRYFVGDMQPNPRRGVLQTLKKTAKQHLCKGLHGNSLSRDTGSVPKADVSFATTDAASSLCSYLRHDKLYRLVQGRSSSPHPHIVRLSLVTTITGSSVVVLGPVLN